MTALLQQQTKLANEWTFKCQSNHEDIVSFFESQKAEILSFGTPWFLEPLIQNHHIETVQYILQHTDQQKYINLQCSTNSQQTPIQCACYYSTFAMVKLIVQNGGKFPTKMGSGLIYSLIEFNKKMKGDEMYLCVEYLLSNLDGKINADNIRFILLYGSSYGDNILPFDCIKIANLIKNKRPNLMNNLSTTNCFGSLDIRYANFNFEFADYLVQHGAKLDPVLFAYTPSNAIIQWLLKHNVNINGNTENEPITPIFRCCLLWDSPDKKYQILELLLNNGADINAKCVYQNKEITPLEYLKQTLPSNYFEYFKHYKPNSKKNDNVSFSPKESNTITTAETSSDEMSDDNKEETGRGRGRGRGYNKHHKESITLQSALNIIDDEVEIFNNKYNENELKEILSKSPQRILNKHSSFHEELFLYENIVNKIINKTNELKQSVLRAKKNIDLLSKPNIKDYVNWTMDEAITWIITLENGKFSKYADELRNGFMQSEITGDIIPDIDKMELKSYGINPLKDRMCLVQHFKSLRNVMQNTEGQNDHQTALI